jgi:hypothetical protein
MDVRAMVVGLLLAGVGLAWGADTPSAPPKRLRCQTFATDPGTAIDTRDAATDLGRWVLGLEDQGWQVVDVDFVLGAKPTGYAQGWTQVCVEPVLAD